MDVKIIVCGGIIGGRALRKIMERIWFWITNVAGEIFQSRLRAEEVMGIDEGDFGHHDRRSRCFSIETQGCWMMTSRGVFRVERCACSSIRDAHENMSGSIVIFWSANSKSRHTLRV